MELFFAQLFGLYFIIVGILVWWRKESFMLVIGGLQNNRALLMVFAFVELAAGLALVLTYSLVSLSIQGVVSLIGWMMLAEAVFYLGAPQKWVQNILTTFNTPLWYKIGGLISIVIGAYLAGVGFSLF